MIRRQQSTNIKEESCKFDKLYLFLEREKRRIIVRKKKPYHHVEYDFTGRKKTFGCIAPSSFKRFEYIYQRHFEFDSIEEIKQSQKVNRKQFLLAHDDCRT